LGLACLLAFSALGLFHAGGAQAQTSSWSLSPASWDFGTRIPNEGPSPAKTFTLTNTGEEQLQVNFVSVGGNAGAGFKIDENHCGGQLSAGGECEIAVTFNPTSPGEKEGELSVATLSGTVPPTSAKLSGIGAGPEMELTPARLDFGALSLGSRSDPAYFTVKSVGVLPMTIGELSLEPTQTYDQAGARANQFELAEGSCLHDEMPPGSSCTIGVVFAPSAVGQLTSRLEVHSDAPGLPRTATVEGTGVTPIVKRPVPPDLSIPHVRILHHPPRHTTSRRATFWLQSSSDTSRIAGRLDHQKFRRCDSLVRYRQLPRGTHRFIVRAFDAEGNLGRITAFNWQIDTRAVSVTRSRAKEIAVTSARDSLDGSEGLGKAASRAAVLNGFHRDDRPLEMAR
jgi:hypothetical protein